jgi:hypothetical protein
MNIKLVQQKMQMQIAINWLEIIQVCEDNINRGFDITYYLEKKENAINQYVKVMADIVEEAIIISKVELFNLN